MDARLAVRRCSSVGTSTSKRRTLTCVTTSWHARQIASKHGSTQPRYMCKTAVEGRRGRMQHVQAASTSAPQPSDATTSSGRAIDNKEWYVDPHQDWRKMGEEDQEDDDDYLSLTAQEIEDRLDEAAAMVVVIHDLRALDNRQFNASLEIWRCIRRVPPWERHRLLAELEPGAVRGLWKASLSRYVLDDARAVELGRGYTLWQDFPEQPGEVYTYLGKCEHYVYEAPQIRFFVDEEMQKNYPRGTPWLKPAQGSLEIPAQNFKMKFFVQPTTGQLLGRVVFPLWGPLDRWWLPCYLRLKLELVLTPVKEDAGADLTFEYPHPGSPDLNGWLGEAALLPQHLPSRSWPAPRLSESCGSPFGISPRDYVRVAAPGVYIGCAYRESGTAGVYNEEDCVYFMIVRRMSKEDYIKQLEREERELAEADESDEE